MSDTSALYDPLIERDLAAIPAAARAFAERHSLEDLWIAVARFAVLAYAPSQHAKRAVMACRAAHDFLSLDLVIACARYAAQSRQPWSEPPILDPPAASAPVDLDVALQANDRLAAERWLAANLDDAHELLRDRVRGDAVLMLDTAIALEATLGVKGRFALMRMVIHELLTPTDHPTDPIEVLIDRAIASNGSIDTVRDVLIAATEGRRDAQPSPLRRGEKVPKADEGSLSYDLANDYAQTLLSHAIAHTLPARADEFLAAVHHNLEQGESFAEWSFA